MKSRADLAVLLSLVLAPAIAPAQTKPAFEVVSVKTAAPIDMAKLAADLQKGGPLPKMGKHLDGARAEYIYMSLQDLITDAYGVKPFQITGPDWLASERFDIFAKLPDGASKEDVPKMLQAVLEDRFKLAAHRESKEFPVLALVLAKGGPKMQESPKAEALDPDAPLAPGERVMDGPEGPVRMKIGKDGSFTMNMGAKGTVSYSMDMANRAIKLEATQVSMDGFADMLTMLGRATGSTQQVKDMTGLKGNYKIAMQFSMEDLIAAGRKFAAEGRAGEASGPAEAADPGNSLSLMQAVQAMGLKLESRKSMLEQLVVDHIEKTPTEN
jgi:uncharacterized protein (TIGR03435 family)